MNPVTEIRSSQAQTTSYLPNDTFDVNLDNQRIFLDSSILGLKIDTYPPFIGPSSHGPVGVPRQRRLIPYVDVPGRFNLGGRCPVSPKKLPTWGGGAAPLLARKNCLKIVSLLHEFLAFCPNNLKLGGLPPPSPLGKYAYDSVFSFVVVLPLYIFVWYHRRTGGKCEDWGYSPKSGRSKLVSANLNRFDTGGVLRRGRKMFIAYSSLSPKTNPLSSLIVVVSEITRTN